MAPSSQDIQRIVDMLVKEFAPQQVVLFGSRANGTAPPESDVDLMVVLPFEGSAISVMLEKVYCMMDQPFAVEVHLRRPLAAGCEPDAVMRDAISRGRVLYRAAA